MENYKYKIMFANELFLQSKLVGHTKIEEIKEAFDDIENIIEKNGLKQKKRR